MKAIAIRPPWVWAILYAGKRVENRPRPSSYRGPVFLHASAGVTLEEYEAAVQAIAEMRRQARSPEDQRLAVPELRPPGSPASRSSAVHCLPRGGLCGIARIVGGRWNPVSDAPFVGWAMSSSPGSPVYGLDLADVRPLPFLPFKGALSVPFNAADQMARHPDQATVEQYRAAWRELGGAL